MTDSDLGIASHTRSRDERDFAAFAEQLTSISSGPSAEYLNRLLEVPDDEYFSALVELVQAVTGAAYVFVGELWGEDWDRVRSLAHHGKRGPLPAFEYDLADTPCANVLTQSVCVFPSAVADLYPKDVLLRQMNIESYVGVPLSDPTGFPLGLLVVLDERPLGPELAQSRRELLAGFRRRSESVLIHRRALRELAAVEQQVDPAGGRVALGQLALAVAHALHVRAAFVAEFADVQQRRLRILAFAVDAELRPGLEYPRTGEPCNDVYESGEAFYAAGAKREFPHSRVLSGPVAESYLGVVMHSRSGEALGHLAILHDRPLHDKLRERPVFQLFRQRIAQELERARHEAEREQAVRRLTEMQRVEALGMLAGGIAHDFNNLLVGIMANAELAQQSLPANAYANARLREVVAASEQAAGLCRQMLAYAGRSRLSKRLFELAPTVLDLESLLIATIPKTIRLSLDINPTRISIEGDPSLVTQVVLNLVTNAAESIGQAQGAITLRVGARELLSDEAASCLPEASVPPGRYAVICVEDTGSGIADDVLPRIFDPFFTTKPKGHGLGLACLLGIVRSHGGGVQVESALHQGSVFTVYLPLAEAETATEYLPRAPFADPGPHATLAAPKRRCILVVDDEPMVRNAASATLTAAGYDILTARDGVEAVECYRKHRKHIDGVLLDLSMPKMGGLEALARMREIDPDVRVLLCSGYVQSDPMDAEIRLGAPLLPKPYRLAQLLHDIHRLLETRSAASSLEAAREESALPAANGGAPSGLHIRS
jgi:two-component system, cell cycle sensor histidine kinase and response regulator CckA